MRAAILSIGSELTHGFLTDTNATFLAQELGALGIEVAGVQQVGDDLQRIVRAFRRALEDADLVVATGGIGPTEDDLTREAVAAVRGEEVYVVEEIADNIRRFFRSRGVDMPEQNVKQAWMIPSAESLLNPMGTAPGWFVRHDQQIVVTMPGVPREMYRMWRDQAVPRILPRLAGRAIVSRTLKTIGIGESAVEREIIDIVQRGDPVVATYAKDDGVHIRITSIGDDRAEADAAVSAAETEIRFRIGAFVYGYLDVSLAAAVLAPIARAGDNVSIWEAGNAGRLRAVLEESDLAEEVVLEARTTAFDEAARRLAVEPAPPSVACACAEAAARESGSRYAVGLAVRVQGGETADRSKGEMAIAIVHPGGVETRQNRVSAVPAEIRRRATMWACDVIWSSFRDAEAGPMA